jgi:hypothetical protein
MVEVHGQVTTHSVLSLFKSVSQNLMRQLKRGWQIDRATEAPLFHGSSPFF